MTLPNAEATAALGEALATTLRAGDTLLLSGPIGAGKSHLARALIQAAARAEGGPAPEVPSPSYTLIQSYAAPLGEIVHADLYRLGDASELAELGLEEAFGEALCIVEWPDRMGDLAPDDAIWVSLEVNAAGRIATLSTADAKATERLKPLVDAVAFS